MDFGEKRLAHSNLYERKDLLITVQLAQYAHWYIGRHLTKDIVINTIRL